MFDSWVKTVVFFVPLGLLVVAVITWLMMRKTVRSRTRVAKQLRDDPDIHEWIVAYNWSRKVLYIPTIVASLLAAVIMELHGAQVGSFASDTAPRVTGGIWLGIFFLNFLVDEYELSIKVLLIALLVLLATFLWLGFFGWVGSFLSWFEKLGVKIDTVGYLFIAAVFLVAVIISWIRGLFYYVAITPNYLNIQFGPTESGEQIRREGYSTRIDTGDFLERLFGFGRVIITFDDRRRLPMQLLVGRIGRVAKRLESIHGKLTVDHEQANAPDNIG